MSHASPLPAASTNDTRLPLHRDLYYGGKWHRPGSGEYARLISPGTGEDIGAVAQASPQDVEAAVKAAHSAFREWKNTLPAHRASLLRRIAALLRENSDELALLDSIDGGNPVSETTRDVLHSAASLEYFAGLITELKGHTVPMGPDFVNFSVREPYGVVAKILAFNHPLLFCVAKTAAPLAAGNTVVVKPSEQAPLSALRYAELIDGILPAGVFNVLPGGRETGAALASHPKVATVGLTGSIGAGRAVLSSAAATIKPVSLELGGKNALIAFDDASVEDVANAITAGMNLTWCGQSCGSTSRALVHSSIYGEVVEKVGQRFAAIRPGLPTSRDTRMGALISQAQLDRVVDYASVALADGARLVCGGKRPDDPTLEGGFFFEPTVFADVRPTMRIAREEVFGPILSMFEWSDEEAMIEAVNGLDFGLTCAIWTKDLGRAHRTAQKVEAGYVWVNNVSQHFQGASFGGYKQSGIGREEGLGELIACTQEKNINIKLAS